MAKVPSLLERCTCERRGRAPCCNEPTPSSAPGKSTAPSPVPAGEITRDEVLPEIREVLQACERAKFISDGYFDPWALPGASTYRLREGWAAQRAAEMLYRPRVGGAVVNAAGDIATCGSPAPGRPFQLGVADPSDRRRIACVVEISGPSPPPAHQSAVTTSSTLSPANGKLGRHLRA